MNFHAGGILAARKGITGPRIISSGPAENSMCEIGVIAVFNAWETVNATKNTDIVPHVARLVSVSGIFLLMQWGHCLSVRVLSTFYQSDVNLANCIRPRKRQFKKYKQLALHWLKNEPLNQVSCQPPQ